MQALPLVLMAGGSLLKGVSAFKAGQYNRAVDQQSAHLANLEGEDQATRIRQAARLTLGRQFGAQAESGFMVNQGSAFDNLLESVTNSELDAMGALHGAMSRAAAYRAQGRAAFQEGKGALIGSVFSGAAQAIGGYNDYAAAGSQYGYGSGGIPAPDLGSSMSFSGGFDPSSAAPAASLPTGY
jgi:hypothetical protein